MILIYTQSLSNRLRYISKLIFGDLLGIGCAFTTFRDDFLSFQGPKLAYATEPVGGEIFIEAGNLLFEETVFPIEPAINSDDRIPVIFPTINPKASLPFDLFAASFYMVTRYEEYERHKHDKYGRFPAHESVAMKGKFLEFPVIHFWTDRLAELIIKRFPGLVITRPEYTFVPTIDIDHAYAFRCRGLSRTAGGIARSLMNFDFYDVLLRFKVLTGTEMDPYDTYGYIKKVHAQYNLSPYYFVLFADYGGDDNNIPVKHKAFHKLLLHLDEEKKVGIHPSLSSNKHLRKLDLEHSGLGHVLEREITLSRQHFMKISFPRTYRNLVSVGITDDFSMGYASHPGFRSGIARPYYFFDLAKNEVLPLKIHPVTLMDVTMKDYLRLTPEQSIETIHRMISMVRSVGGEFISLCHNETFSEYGRWLGWRNIYEELLRFAAH
ncbi:MAG: polysaccharide deacetylase family protein [Bacteroidetes bacterium]|nr:polysaccharide deacetylase family protein [Bacteroidota bacterium]